MMRSIFHEPWWLDAVAPDHWREVHVIENGRTAARMPFVERRMLGARMLLAPPLSSRLGPLVDLPPGRYETQLRRADHLVNELIDNLPAADLVRQTLHPDTISWLPFYRRGFRVEPQLSYVIERLSDLDTVWNGISGSTRRVIKNAGKRLEVVHDDTADRLKQMVRTTFQRQVLDVPYDVDILDRVVQSCKERGRASVVSAIDQSGTLHASLLCVWDDQRAWYMGGGGDPRLRSSGGGSLLMWELIKESANHVDRFDFEGSMLPAVERYFRNFGGRQETCFTVTRASRRIAAIWALVQRRRTASARKDGRSSGETSRLTGAAAGRLRFGRAR
jgi:GNAT acetyltransferase-like protein